jgi:hypothetical protein
MSRHFPVGNRVEYVFIGLQKKMSRHRGEESLPGVSQTYALGWLTVLRQHVRPGGGRFVVQMGQYLSMTAGSSIQQFDASTMILPGTALTGFNIDLECAQLKTRSSRCIHVIDAWRSTGVLSSQCSSLG